MFDCHTHVYPAGVAGFWKRPSSVEELISAMDVAGVRRAAVIAIAPYIPNSVVVDAVRAYPDRLVAIGSVEPCSDDSPESVEDAVQRLGVRGIKIHPRLQGVGLPELRRIIPLAERCGALGVPLVICSWPSGRDVVRGQVLELWSEVAAACPATVLVLAHAGAHRPLETLMLLKAHPNVAVDLSYTPWYFRGSSVIQDLLFLIRKADPHRVLFGSDFPEASMAESAALATDLLQRAGLNAADAEAVLDGNAERLFGRG
jgi:predicted TIM-barrel fold metal-dependent hydrolase